MIAVIDTSIVKSQRYFFESASMRAIAAAQSVMNLEIIIPRVVVLESVNLYRNDLTVSAQRIQKEIRNISELGVQTARLSVPSDIIEKSVSSYLEKFEGNTFNLSLQVQDYPTIDHSAVVEAAISKRRPFTGNDGYRDFLIWHTVVELARKSGRRHPVSFISGNRNDFSANVTVDSQNEAGILHEDFLLDLDFCEVPRDSVKYFESVEAFRNVLVGPFQEQVRSIGEDIENWRMPDQFFDEVNRVVNGHLSELVNLLPPTSFGLSPDVTSIEGFTAFSDIESADVRQISDTEYFFRASLVVEVEFEVETFRDSALGLQLSMGPFTYVDEKVTGTIEAVLEFDLTGVFGEAPDYDVKRIDLDYNGSPWG